MIASKVLIAGGLIFTLSAFGPAFAQSSKDSKTSPTSYSENSNTGSSTAHPESGDQNQNATAVEPSGQNGSQAEGRAENSSDEQSENQNAGAQNGWSENQAQSNQSSKNQINTPTPDQLARQADHVQRQIHHLDKDLTDAVQYENTAREDWNNKDLTGARNNFRIAEHILMNATGGATFQPAMLGQSAQEREKMAEHAIDREKARGIDVSSAEQCLTRGKDALKRGDQMQASRDFREAELSLGIPVEVGYAEVWEAGTPRTARSTQENNSSPNRPEAATSSRAQTTMNSRQDGIGDARTFIDNGQRALDNGNTSEAERDFRAADRALSMNDQNLQNTSNTSNSSMADPGSR